MVQCNYSLDMGEQTEYALDIFLLKYLFWKDMIKLLGAVYNL